MCELISQSLTASTQSLLNTVKVLPRPHPGDTIAIPKLSRHDFPQHGNDILLVIPTANKHKTRILTETLERRKPQGATIHVLIIPAESNVGEQPYNEAGVQGARNRIENALQSLASSGKAEAVLSEKKIGTVIAASIENFIQRPSADTGTDPVDYGVVMVYNATTRQVVLGISRGVTVPKKYFDHARSLGLEQGQDENHGRVTVGEVLAANVEGLDKANWHAVVAGVSRYDLLREAADEITIPW